MRDRSGLKQSIAALRASAEAPVLWRLHQSDITARNFGATSPVAVGYPTVVTLGSTPTCMAGSWVAVSGVVGMTQLNGAWRCLWRSGNAVALDVDSSGFSAWVSGGTITPTIVQDEFQVGPPNMPLQGTLTNVFDNPMQGITAHSGGTNTLRQTADLERFDLTGFRGRLVHSLDLWINAAPSADEGIFGIGPTGAADVGSASGCFTLQLENSRQLKWLIRPRTAADGQGSHTFVFSGALTLQTRYKAALVIDFADAPASAMSYVILNGAQVRSTAVTMTNAVDPLGVAGGMAFGARILAGPSYNLSGRMGSLGSGLRVQEMLWWRTTKSLTDTMRAVRTWHRTGSMRLMA